MGLTEYRALLIDCDEVLVDRDAGVWAALQPLMGGCANGPDREQALTRFHEIIVALYPRFDELGFSGLLCFAHRQLAECLGARSSFEEDMTFARTVGNWTLFEDAPGAMLYLRKFYHLLVCVDRDAEERGVLAQRLGLAAENLVSLAGNRAQCMKALGELDIDPADTLLLTRSPNRALAGSGLCYITRGRVEPHEACPVEYCISSMADLVRQHQLSLRR